VVLLPEWEADRFSLAKILSYVGNSISKLQIQVAT
jgi:hypothetical protein